MLDLIGSGISLVVLILYMVIIFFLFEIKSRMEGEEKTFVYLIIAMIVLVAIRILNLFALSNIFSVPYLSSAIVILFAVFALLAAISYYNAIKRITDKDKKSIKGKMGGKKKHDSRIGDLDLAEKVYKR